MRRIVSGLIALAVIGLPFVQSSVASANTITGGGFSSSYAGESVFTNNAAGETGQMSAIFFNDGTQPWFPSVVGLLVCAADKVTCNVSSNPSFKSGWYSNTVYATVTSTVAPGQNGFFIYDFTVPVGTPQGTVTTFYGDVGLIATGTELRPQGYFQVNSTPSPAFTLTMAPSSASVAVGATQQFTLGGAPIGAQAIWTVLGGCGAVTSAGLFAATSINSPSQPCTVLASLSGVTVSAPITVYGQPSALVCTASPTTVIANNGSTGGTSTLSITLKDVNGNTAANASTPVVQVSNSTPNIGTVTPPTGALTPLNGVVTLTMSSTLSPGLFEISASAVGLTGCFVFVTSANAGPPVSTTASFIPPVIAADGVSTSTLRIDTVDSGGNRAVGDNSTGLLINANSGAGICSFTGASTAGSNVSASGGSATATVASGRVELVVSSTSTPGTCSFTVLTNNSAVSGTSISLSTQIVGAPNQIGVVSSESPRPASGAGGTCAVALTPAPTDVSCARVIVEVRDYNGARETGDNSHTITATMDPNSCTGAGAAVTLAASTPTVVAGRATFAFRSAGGYPGCVITFSSTGLTGTSTTMTWTAGAADHLGCVFSPPSIAPDGASGSSAQVTARDAANNIVNTNNYTVTFSLTGGSGSTTLISPTQQTMSGGYAYFTVRSTTTAGTDTYTPSISFGSQLPHSPIPCSIAVHY